MRRQELAEITLMGLDKVLTETMKLQDILIPPTSTTSNNAKPHYFQIGMQLELMCR